MGLTVSRTARSRWFTAALLAAALLLDLTWPPADARERLARRLLGGDVVQVDLEDGPAFQSGTRWLLFFENAGMVGPIAGALLVDDDRIAALHILASREGIDHEALAGPRLGAALAGQPARAPVEVDVVSGATISSQALIDAVNQCLRRWRAAVR